MRPFESRWERVAPYALGALFGLCVALLAVSIVMFKKAEDRGASAGGARGAPSERVEGERGGAIIEATRRVSPAVVSVTALRTKVVPRDPFYRWFQQYYYGQVPDLSGERYSMLEYSVLGSGVIVDPDGYILTNEHVIRDAEKIYVTMGDGTQAEATVAGSTASYDLALLKIQAKNIPYAPLGDSDKLETGEWVIAIGNPFGYLLNDTQSTVTVGVVSALHRDVKPSSSTQPLFMNMIQTDAAINPGNSGGPLVSSAGEVIGINTFIFSTGEGGSLGMGFAIPINTTKQIIDEIRRYGRVREPWTGLSVGELTPEAARRQGLDVDRGLLIGGIYPGSPASEAGFRVGDVIVDINGIKIRNVDQAYRAFFGHRVGDVLSIVVHRDRKSVTVQLKLAEQPKRA
jgi:serine protease Do